MGEATGLAKGLERQFGVTPDLDICGKRGASIVLTKPATLDVARTEETVSRATFTLKAIHARLRGTIVSRNGASHFVLGHTGQSLPILAGANAPASTGREMEAVVSLVGWDRGPMGIAAFAANSPPVPLGGR